MKFLGSLTLLLMMFVTSLPGLAQPAFEGHFVNSMEHGTNQKAPTSDVSFRKMSSGKLRMIYHKDDSPRRYFLENGGKYTAVVDGKRRVMEAEWTPNELKTVETRYSSRGKETAQDHSTWTISEDGTTLTRKVVIPPYTAADGTKVTVPYEATLVYFRKGADTDDFVPDDEDEKGDAPVADAGKSSDKTEPASDEFKPPAELIVLSKQHNPNTYTGEVTFDAVVVNQGGSTATEVRANFVVVGPDGKTWINKTLYRGPMKPGEKWNIHEEYKHRGGGVAVTDQDGRTFEVTVKPMFESKKEKKDG